MLNEKELEEIRRKLLELEEEPPVEGWKNIKKEIQPDNGWNRAWWILPVLLLLLTGVGILIHQKRKGNSSGVAISQEKGFRKELSSTLKQEETKVKAPANQNLTNLGNGTLLQVPGSGSFAAQSQLPLAKELNTVAANPASNIEISRKDALGTGSNALSTDTSYSEMPKNNNDLAVNETNRNTLTNATDVAKGRPESQVTFDTKHFSQEDSTVANSNSDIFITPVQADTTHQIQKIDKAKERKPRDPESWTVGLLFSPRYAFRKFTPNTQDETLITRMQRAQILNTTRMGYEYGVNVSKAVNKRFYLEAGLTLMQLKEDVAYSYTLGRMDSTALRMNFAADGSVKVSSDYIIEDRQLKSSYRYGGLRIGTTYYFGQNSQSRFNITLAGGLNLLVKGRTQEYINGEWSETIIFPSKDNILEQSNYNILIGMGYNTILYKSFELMVMPTLNYFLGSTYINREPFGLRPYSIGLTFQVKKLMGIKPLESR